ncbi:sigma-70 family RNA polymerase sigma factor [Horticoccus luteus]|uniref:Sigma-70 family RNA polymerase sigma factor n=1 Tax=Horticoccus luteus TaxID=2862869 RepID=A0A8F9XLM5_9BACT|nr:sigma-70 family RNA polymerase sigma factor [Horticoccus luteus]QYM79376.1 sigma-70 family RNA polymerase sigma factor [Horticoccus luteus]
MESSAESNEELSAGLVSRIARGDEEAFGTLYDALSPRLFGLVCAILADAAEAEDVMQECFLHVWNNAHRFDPARGSVTTWLFLLFRSRAIDRRRRHRRREGHVELSGMTESSSPFDLATVPGQGAPAGEDGIIHAALHDLPEDQRRAIDLAFFGGLTHHEIATQLATPVGTIKARIRRGLMRLASLLADPA